jgi:hypothetical protein
MTVFLFLLVLSGGCGFYLALRLDRPDLLAVVDQRQQGMLQVAFLVLFLLVLAKLSWPQIRYGQLGIAPAVRILVRNVLVLVAGLILCTYIGRMLLDGIDHSHHRALW